jgi:hypothetical protein
MGDFLALGRQDPVPSGSIPNEADGFDQAYTSGYVRDCEGGPLGFPSLVDWLNPATISGWKSVRIV